jgi:protein NirF
MLHIIITLFLLTSSLAFAEKLYVVERERSALAVIENGEFKKEIKNIGNATHTTVKTDKNFAYAVSRDGYMSKIDKKSDKLLKKIKVGNSGIGFTILDKQIVVANYDPKNVVVINKDMEILKNISTDSRNVGIKHRKNLVVFSLMDKDQIWILDKNKNFSLLKKYENVGQMPFDALLYKNIYIAGFFRESGLGVLNLDNFKYLKKPIRIIGKKEAVMKVPHFGTWGIIGDKGLIPAVGERKAVIFDFNKFGISGYIDLIGLPVFISVSPNKKFAAVNYSGDKENFITIIDLKKLKPVKNLEVGKRVMHLRFSKDSKKLYITSYFEHKLKIINTKNWKIEKEVLVPTPSGIFIID